MSIMNGSVSINPREWKIRRKSLLKNKIVHSLLFLTISLSL